MSSEEQEPVVRVSIPLGGSTKETFLAFRRWAEKIAANNGKEMGPYWYSKYPTEEEPEGGQ